MDSRTGQSILTILDSIVGSRVIPPEEAPTPARANGWELCPVVNMLGVPLAIKKVSACQCQQCVGCTATQDVPANQIATRLAIEPQTGRAPFRWAGSGTNHLGTVWVARTDGQAFTSKEYAILDEYIFNNIFDVWGLDPPDRDRMLPSVYNRQAYSRYFASRMSEDGMRAGF